MGTPDLGRARPGEDQDQAKTKTAAQLIEHRVVMREVVSSTPAGPPPRVLK